MFKSNTLPVMNYHKILNFIILIKTFMINGNIVNERFWVFLVFSTFIAVGDYLVFLSHYEIITIVLPW